MVFHSVLCKVYTSTVRYQHEYGTVEVLQKLPKSLVENVIKINGKNKKKTIQKKKKKKQNKKNN